MVREFEGTARKGGRRGLGRTVVGREFEGTCSEGEGGEGWDTQCSQ
jgi:hypothetical protein